MLRTLAAAYAEAGQFAEAVTTVQQALNIATLESNAGLVDPLREQMEYYQAGKPFRDPPSEQ